VELEFHKVLSLVDAHLFWCKSVDSITGDVNGILIGIGLPTEFVLEMSLPTEFVLEMKYSFIKKMK